MLAHISASGLRTLIDLGAVTFVMLPLIYGALSFQTHPAYRTTVVLLTPSIGLTYLRFFAHIPALHWLALGICILGWIAFLAITLSTSHTKPTNVEKG